MCKYPSDLSTCNPLYAAFLNGQPSVKGHNLRYLRLNRRRRSSKQTKEKKMAIVKAEMEIKNLKLYMENKNIIEENERLRKQAFLLHQENQALLYQLQKKHSNHCDLSAHGNKNSH